VKNDIVIGNASHVGKVRKINEDYMLYIEPKSDAQVDSRGRLIIVADGMGGHAAGDFASRLACTTVNRAYYNLTSNDPRIALRKALEEANAIVFKEAQKNNMHSGMGTTLSALVLHGGRAYIGHVGDSRIYRVSKGSIEQITVDHSLVQRMVDDGLISPSDADNHSERNVLTGAIGSKETVEVYSPEPIDVRGGDIFVICSDGLYGLVSDQEIMNLVMEHNPIDASRLLIDLANNRGGHDNITVQVVKINKDYVKATLSSLAWVMVFALFFAVGAFSYVTFFKNNNNTYIETPHIDSDGERGAAQRLYEGDKHLQAADDAFDNNNYSKALGELLLALGQDPNSETIPGKLVEWVKIIVSKEIFVSQWENAVEIIKPLLNDSSIKYDIRDKLNTMNNSIKTVHSKANNAKMFFDNSMYVDANREAMEAKGLLSECKMENATVDSILEECRKYKDETKKHLGNLLSSIDKRNIQKVRSQIETLNARNLFPEQANKFQNYKQKGEDLEGLLRILDIPDPRKRFNELEKLQRGTDYPMPIGDDIKETRKSIMEAALRETRDAVKNEDYPKALNELQGAKKDAAGSTSWLKKIEEEESIVGELEGVSSHRKEKNYSKAKAKERYEAIKEKLSSNTDVTDTCKKEYGQIIDGFLEKCGEEKNPRDEKLKPWISE